MRRFDESLFVTQYLSVTTSDPTYPPPSPIPEWIRMRTLVMHSWPCIEARFPIFRHTAEPSPQIRKTRRNSERRGKTVSWIVIGLPGLFLFGCYPPPDVDSPPRVGTHAEANRTEDHKSVATSGERTTKELTGDTAPTTESASPPTSTPSSSTTTSSTDSAAGPASATLEAGDAAADVPAGRPISLFDGATLDGWKGTRFGGEGEVYVDSEAIHLGFGQPMTGITIDVEHPQGKIPTMNYEISLEAQRVEGGDFFCALTFPVLESYCTLVVGGWGGSVVGISSIDDMDAADNPTTQYMRFKEGQWYPIRVRVTPGRIEAWIDGKRMVNQDVSGSRLSTRIEVDLNKPLGIASFATHAALRKIEMRPVESRE